MADIASPVRAGLKDQLQLRDPAPLWEYLDPDLEEALARSIADLGLEQALREKKLAVSLVDTTDLAHPRVAALNGDTMLYAASLPKIAVMLGVFQKASEGKLVIDDETRAQLQRMIRRSSNEDATALMHKVGLDYIARTLISARYRLYDPFRNGGLWAGKDYASVGAWRRDPIDNLSHGATPMQIARFYYLLQTGRLVNAQASAEMKELLGHSAIHHKFVKRARVDRSDGGRLPQVGHLGHQPRGRRVDRTPRRLDLHRSRHRGGSAGRPMAVADHHPDGSAGRAARKACRVCVAPMCPARAAPLQ